MDVINRTSGKRKRRRGYLGIYPLECPTKLHLRNDLLHTSFVKFVLECKHGKRKVY